MKTAFCLLILAIPTGGLATVPTDQEGLREWWDGAGRLWMGDSGYVVTGRVRRWSMPGSIRKSVLLPVQWRSACCGAHHELGVYRERGVGSRLL